MQAFKIQLSILFVMGRKRGFDDRKIADILSYLARNPDGAWLRQIAKDLSLSPTTVAKYIEGTLRTLVEDTTLGRTEKPLLRVIKLKPAVLEKLAEGKDIQQIMKLLRLMSKLE